MSDAKELAERLDDLAKYLDHIDASDKAQAVVDDARDWIERWAPVEVRALLLEQARKEMIVAGDIGYPAARTEYENVRTDLVMATIAALGEDKP